MDNPNDPDGLWPLVIDRQPGQPTFLYREDAATFATTNPPICIACGDTGKDSRGNDCIPCTNRKRLKK